MWAGLLCSSLGYQSWVPLTWVGFGLMAGAAPCTGWAGRGGPCSFTAPEKEGWTVHPPAQASPDGHKCWSCHAAMSFPVPFLKEFSAGSVEGMRGFFIPVGLATLWDKLWLQGNSLLGALRGALLTQTLVMGPVCQAVPML